MNAAQSRWANAKAVARRLRSGRQLPSNEAVEDPQEVETLGTVHLSTGRLMIIDFGLLKLWAHDDVPHLNDDVVDASIAQRANAAIDYELVGIDALKAAASLDLASSKGTFVFDRPDGTESELFAKVAELAAAQDLDVEVRAIARMPHAQRARTLLNQKPTGTEIQFHGPWAVGVAGLPIGVDLAVVGQRMPEAGPEAGRWRSVWVEVGIGQPIARSEHIGHVLVDEARLLMCDLDMLGEWIDNEPVDGLFDVAFWGRDAEAVAARVAAGTIDEQGGTAFGWQNLDLAAAKSLVQKLHDMQNDGEGNKFVVDARPHDHAYAILSQARVSETASGTINLAGGTGTGWFTTWGDGAFPVYRDCGADGVLQRVRVEFAAT